VEDQGKRTVFVGNLPQSILKSRSEQAQLKQLFKMFGQIESVRFRSIALAPNLPKKAASITAQVSENRDSLNGYVVFKSEASVSKAVQQLNATVFLGKHLRLDSVAHPEKQQPKRSVFIGGLSYTASEETLWQYFSEIGEIDYVRIVRDPETNIGRGIAYVQFADVESVNKALLLDGHKIPGDRKVRVSRARVVKRKEKRQRGDKHDRLSRLAGKGSSAKLKGRSAAAGPKRRKTTDRSKAWKSKKPSDGASLSGRAP